MAVYETGRAEVNARSDSALSHPNPVVIERRCRTRVRELRYCATVAGGTMFFFNQMGRAHPKAGGRELDRRTWDEMPARRALEAA